MEAEGANGASAKKPRAYGDPIAILADHIEEIGLEPVGVSQEYRYASLPLCVIDAVFSIGVKYTSTQATVARFCDKTGWPRFATLREDRGAGTRSLSDLLALYDGLTSEAAAQVLFGKRSLPDRDWSRNVQDTEMQELFARLTAQFEDCAALAAEGQRAGLSREEAGKLFRKIRETARAAKQSLSRVEQYLGG